MMYEDVIRDFAIRTKINLAIIEKLHKNGMEAYETTQLVNSCLGLLVFPQQHFIERIPETPMEQLVQEGWPVPQVTGQFHQVANLMFNRDSDRLFSLPRSSFRQGSQFPLKQLFHLIINGRCPYLYLCPISKLNVKRFKMNINSLLDFSPVAFENLVVDLLAKMGFEAMTTKISGDGGIDVIAVSKQPIIGGKYLIQCKRYSDTNIGEPIIRELYGIMHAEKANKGILITTSSFTKNALIFAHDKQIELIDGTMLVNLLANYFEEQFFLANNGNTVNLNIFNEIEWGSAYQDINGLTLIKRPNFDDNLYKLFKLQVDTLEIGGANIDEVFCYFYRDRFYHVEAFIKGYKNSQTLFDYLLRQCGHNFEMNDDDNRIEHKWESSEVRVRFIFYKTNNDSCLEQTSKTIEIKKEEDEEVMMLQNIIERMQKEKSQLPKNENYD